MPDASNKQELAKLFTLLTQLSYRNLKNIKEFANSESIPADKDIKQFIFELMNPCDALFGECLWKGESYNCCDSFFPVFTESGFCYSFNSRFYERQIPWSEDLLPEFNMRYIKETDSKWSLKLVVLDISDLYNLTVYIHNSDEIPGIDVKPQHIWDFKVNRILFSVKQTYTTDDARQLTVKQRNCIFEHEFSLKMYDVYTFSGCTQQCRMDTSVRLCGCVPPFYPENIKHNYRHCKLKELACIADNLRSIENVEKCRCYLGCSNTIYEVEKLNDNSADELTNSLETEFVSWPMVRYKREVLFGWVDLLVSFGGIAGLFLGFSLLSGVEVLYYFTIRAFCKVHQEKNELVKIEDQNVSKPKTDYDLSLVPYFIKQPDPGQGRKQVLKKYRKHINFPSHLDATSIKQPSKKYSTVLAPFGIEFLN